MRLLTYLPICLGQLSQCSRNGVLVSSTNAPGTTVPKISTTPTTVTTTTTTTTAVSSFLSGKNDTKCQVFS